MNFSPNQFPNRNLRNPPFRCISSLTLRSKCITCALVNLKFRYDVESFDLKVEVKFGNSNENTNFALKLQNSSLGVSAYFMMSGT